MRTLAALGVVSAVALYAINQHRSLHARAAALGPVGSIFDLSVPKAGGGQVDLSTYAGKKKAFLIVNVASE